VQNAVLQMPAHGAGEHHALQVAALLDQIAYLVAVRHADYVLLDDRTIVQHLCHVVAGRSYQLDAPVIRRLVGARAAECRKKRMMHVNDALGLPRHEHRREHLHVTRQHDQLDSVALRAAPVGLLRLRLVGLGFIHGHMMERIP